MEPQLEGTTAIITGAGHGLGRTCAVVFARAGVHVVVADIDDDGARDVVAEASTHARAAAFHLDVTSDDGFAAIRDFALEEFGRVDIVMNNAGAIAYGRPEDIPVDAWRRVFDVNLLALVRSNAVFVPHFLAQGSGHIVNTASTAGLYTYQWTRTPYAATKAGVISLSEALAAYLRPRGVGVTCLCPATMAGPSTLALRVGNPPVYGDAIPGQGPGFPPIETEEVAARVLDAIRNDQFLLQTHPDDVQPILVERARDPEGFVARAAALLAPPPPVV